MNVTLPFLAIKEFKKKKNPFLFHSFKITVFILNWPFNWLHQTLWRSRLKGEACILSGRGKGFLLLKRKCPILEVR